MDGRIPLETGSALTLGTKTYYIEHLIGCGATSFVYAARYDDSLHSGTPHSVMIKELFPYHPKGLITRGENGEITVPAEAESYFALRKKSFLRGNIAHITLQNTRADMTGVNIDSFEACGSVYTILGSSNGETLRNVQNEGTSALSVPTVLHWMQRLLDALEVFHQNGLLHLDISPDNILLLPLGDGKPEQQRRILLIDFNSVWEAGELSESSEVYFCVKENYTAPEVRLRQQGSICAASDLFSVCAVFFELLSGKPLDYSVLYTGGRIIDTGSGLLANASLPVKEKASEILQKGLKMPPKRRFQSIGELRLELDSLEKIVQEADVLNRASRLFKKRAAAIAFITLSLAFLLSFAAIRIHERLSGYPVTVREQYAADSAMTALAASLGKLGELIGNDMSAFSAYRDGKDAFWAAVERYGKVSESLLPEDAYTAKSLDAFRTDASPIRFDLLLELLNAPLDYHEQSDRMIGALREVLSDGTYPEEDCQTIISLYSQYAEVYADTCYIKMQLTALPLNEDGRKELLRALPYAQVFGNKLMTQPFGADKADLESALTAAGNRQNDILVQLKSYGVNVE